MVHRHIHGTVVTIFTRSITPTGQGYLSHTYSSQYSDPASGERRGGETLFEDTFTPLREAGPWVLTRRVVKSTETEGQSTEQVFHFKDLVPLTANDS
jgi:hypothetical protein